MHVGGVRGHERVTEGNRTHPRGQCEEQPGAHPAQWSQAHVGFDPLSSGDHVLKNEGHRHHQPGHETAAWLVMPAQEQVHGNHESHRQQQAHQHGRHHHEAQCGVSGMARVDQIGDHVARQQTLLRRQGNTFPGRPETSQQRKHRQRHHGQHSDLAKRIEAAEVHKHHVDCVSAAALSQGAAQVKLGDRVGRWPGQHRCQVGRGKPDERHARHQPADADHRQGRQPVILGLPGGTDGAGDGDQPKHYEHARARYFRPVAPAEAAFVHRHEAGDQRGQHHQKQLRLQAARGQQALKPACSAHFQHQHALEHALAIEPPDQRWSFDLPALDRRAQQQHQQFNRQAHPARRLVGRVRQPGRFRAEEHIDREPQGIGHAEDPGDRRDHRQGDLDPVGRGDEHGLGKEHFLGQETIEQRHPGHRCAGDHGQRGGVGHQLDQPAQFADVAGTAFMVNNARRHEQRSLERGVVEDMKHRRHCGQRTVQPQQQGDQAQVADGGVGQQALEVVLKHRRISANHQHTPTPGSVPPWREVARSGKGTARFCSMRRQESGSAARGTTRGHGSRRPRPARGPGRNCRRRGRAASSRPATPGRLRR
nr:hypothetical protein [Tanacetum cinerariifolium]